MITNSSLLQNEVGFDALFCDQISTKDYSIYYNTHFWDDPIFNHVTFADTVLDSESHSPLEVELFFKEIIGKTFRANVPASLYLDRFWRNSKNIEKDAIDFGFLIIEQMHILRKFASSSLLVNTSGIPVGPTTDIALWNKAFIRSFGIPQTWLEELSTRLNQIGKNPKAVLLAAVEDGTNEAAGCSLLLIDPPECLGVYCVGTVPEKRGRGVARALMAAAEDVARKRNCEVLALQTIASDGVAPMYLKMGYETAFERDVLQFRE